MYVIISHKEGEKIETDNILYTKKEVRLFIFNSRFIEIEDKGTRKIFK